MAWQWGLTCQQLPGNCLLRVLLGASPLTRPPRRQEPDAAVDALQCMGSQLWTTVDHKCILSSSSRGGSSSSRMISSGKDIRPVCVFHRLPHWLSAVIV